MRCSSRLAPYFTIVFALIAIASSGCVSAYKQSVGAQEQKVFSRIYVTDFNTAWQAVLDSLKNSSLDVSNREGGFLQTKWTDNTADKNFTDSYGSAESYLKAQYRFRVNISKGAAYNGVPSTKVTVQKEQMIQRDVLEGWQPVETDTIEENTVLYRIGRLIAIKIKLAQLEQQKTQSEIEKSKF